MDLNKLSSDIYKMDKGALQYRLQLLRRKFRRLIHWLGHLFVKDKFNIRDVPVIINNRNRLSYLVLLLRWLEKAGMKNIFIIDNDSTYPPLLEFYRQNKYNVIYAGSNVGYRALWIMDDLRYLLSDYYVYTDPDVVPTEDCPLDVVNFMYKSLKNNFLIDKIGVGLKIDDLPEHNNLRQEIINWEKQFWTDQVKPYLYKAKVDTTFALYAPFAEGGGECKAYRTAPPFIARHLPWYENTSSPGAEELYYKNNSAAFSSHWTTKRKV